MLTPPAHYTLEQFRLAAYQTLGLRKDSLFELMEAALAGSGPETLVRLSLAPAFRRGWPSAPDALADGAVDADRCRALVHTTLGAAPLDGRPVWALDGTVWPRPAAQTSPARTYGHRTSPGIPQSGVVPSWEYEWLVAVPEPQGSWVLPLDLRRRGPTDGTPTAVALALLRATLAQWSASAPRPVVALDSGYDPTQLARARLPADLLVRLRANRTFYRPPGPYRGRGAPRKYGAVFKLGDPATQGGPDRRATCEDPRYGRVAVAVWEDLRARGAADAPVTVVRVQVERLPRRATPRRRSGWPGSGAPCPPTCSICGAGTAAASPPSMGSASSSTTSAGRPCGRPIPRRRTAGLGCWRWRCGSSGWPARWWPTSACPGNRRWPWSG